MSQTENLDANESYGARVISLLLSGAQRDEALTTEVIDDIWSEIGEEVIVEIDPAMNADIVVYATVSSSVSKLSNNRELDFLNFSMGEWYGLAMQPEEEFTQVKFSGFRNTETPSVGYTDGNLEADDDSTKYHFVVNVGYPENA